MAQAKTLTKEEMTRVMDYINTRCWRRSNIDHLCRLNFDQGLEPAFMSAGCG